jgi:2'-5' RNA ligase
MQNKVELIKKTRAFFAIGIVEDLQSKITILTRQLEKHAMLAKINWVKPENLHITLRFLGEIDAEQHRQLVKQVVAKINQVKQFEISFTHLEFFPSFTQPLVLALMPKPSVQLTALAQMLEQIAIDCGIAAEQRPFVAHLTLGQFNGQNRFSAADQLILSQEKLPENMHFTTKEMILYRSEAQQYLPLNRFQLMVN